MRIKIGVIVVALLVAGFVSQVSATPILDQSQASSDGASRVYVTRSLCQTFTSGQTGNLTEFSILLDSVTYNEQAPATISIIGTTGGVPNDGNVLWTGSFTNLAPGWFDVDTSVSAPSLTVGNVYGIRITSPDPATSSPPDDAWNTAFSGNSYSGGSLWNNRGSGWVTISVGGTSYPDADAAFRTYMTPEPATMALLGMGFILIARRRRLS